MSTLDEIREVYQSEIDHKTAIVRQRQGIQAFLPRNMVNGVDGYSVFEHTKIGEIEFTDDFTGRNPRCRSKKARRRR